MRKHFEEAATTAKEQRAWVGGVMISPIRKSYIHREKEAGYSDGIIELGGWKAIYNDAKEHKRLLGKKPPVDGWKNLGVVGVITDELNMLRTDKVELQVWQYHNGVCAMVWRHAEVEAGRYTSDYTVIGIVK